MPRYDTVLLGADNTLFDFDAAEHAALRRALEERGYPFTPETEALYLDINRPLWAAFDRGEVTQDFLVVERFRLLVERLGGSDDPVSFNRDYLTYLGEGNQLLPGAEDLCRDLRAAGCRLALATNGVARVQHARLDASPLKPYFSAVIISQEVGAQKPQPAFFQAALEALGVLDKARCVMVGDTLGSDIQGGIAAGLDTIWYDPLGRSPGDLRPTYIAASFQEVRQYIIEE